VKTLTACVLSAIFALSAAACGGSKGVGSSTATAPLAGEDLRARCERFVAKAEQFGSTEAESTHEQKVDFCMQQNPPKELLDCVDRATTKAEADAC
jgi:hypothetical protein